MLKKAQVVIENYRREYNTICSHSSLNNRPPAPEAILPMGLQQHWVTRYGPEMILTLTKNWYKRWGQVSKGNCRSGFLQQNYYHSTSVIGGGEISWNA